jgi:hypothetical protein
MDLYTPRSISQTLHLLVAPAMKLKCIFTFTSTPRCRCLLTPAPPRSSRPEPELHIHIHIHAPLPAPTGRGSAPSWKLRWAPPAPRRRRWRWWWRPLPGTLRACVLPPGRQCLRRRDATRSRTSEAQRKTRCAAVMLSQPSRVGGGPRGGRGGCGLDRTIR